MSVLSRLQKRFSYPLLSGQSVGRILRRSLLLLLALMAVIVSAFYLTLRTLNQESYLRERYRQSLSLLQQTDRSLQVSLNHSLISQTPPGRMRGSSARYAQVC